MDIGGCLVVAGACDAKKEPALGGLAMGRTQAAMSPWFSSSFGSSLSRSLKNMISEPI